MTESSAREAGLKILWRIAPLFSTQKRNTFPSTHTFPKTILINWAGTLLKIQYLLTVLMIMASIKVHSCHIIKINTPSAATMNTLPSLGMSCLYTVASV